MPANDGTPLEWTGERYIPEVSGQVALEHVHRYLCARTYCHGKVVLDVASGEGYGSALLAEKASRVIGVDLSGEAIAHARARYRHQNLEFQQGSCTRIPLPDASIDVVVSFETIEHIDMHDEMLAEIKRVLRPGGLLVISSPDKKEYSDIPKYKNTYHVKELYKEEFESLLSKYFKCHVILGQRVLYGSVIAAERSGAPFVSYHMEEDANIGTSGLRRPLYLLAVATDGTLPTPVDSVMETAFEQSELVQSLAQQIHGAGTEITRLNSEITRQNDALARASEQKSLLVVDRMELAYRLAQSEADRRQAKRELKAMRRNFTWRVTRPLRWLLAFIAPGKAHPAGATGTAGGVRSVPARIKLALKKKHELVSTIDSANRAPLISIIVPISRGLEETKRCIASAMQGASRYGAEIIAIGDTRHGKSGGTDAPSGNVRYLTLEPPGIGVGALYRVVAAETHGEYVLFLNESSIVLPGALDAMVETFLQDPTIGEVGAKIVSPNGRLLEAGAIMAADGATLSHGRNGDLDAPEYNYLRDVDFCSAGAIMVPRTVLPALGNLLQIDRRNRYAFADLAFSIRSSGKRVVYQPLSEVIAIENESGDPGSTRASQKTVPGEQELFVEKWRASIGALGVSLPMDGRVASDRSAQRRILLIAPRIPTPDMDSGSVDLVNVMRVLMSLRFQVTFAAETETVKPSKYIEHLQGMGVECLHTPYLDSIPAHLMTYGKRYDVFMLVRAPIAAKYLDMVRGLFPMAKTVFNTTDLHYLRAERRHALLPDSISADVVQQIRHQELNAIRRADMTVVVSEHEKRLLEVDAAGANVVWIPAIYKTRALPALSPTGRSAVTFIGGFGHHPNQDAIVWFCREVWPILERNSSEIELLIVGSKPPKAVEALATGRIRVLGYVPDLKPIMDKTRMTIAPLRYGAGQKGKIVHSLAEGIPCVSTSVGVEGMGLTDGTNVLVADSPDSFAERIIQLMHDEELWLRLSQAGYEHVLEVHNIDRCREMYRQAFATLLPEMCQPDDRLSQCQGQ